ncbi:MAG: cation:proton antiporter [Phototrophicaceae bacterium]|jgi:Kef-type K+ transport system membrane component KefB/nucleotide-binding universal stress UspA family protein
MQQPFTAASHHDILVLLVQLGVLLFASRMMGELAQRLKQPSVVGEILAGIILGPSLLSSFVPLIGQWVIPHTPVQGYLLEVVSLLGAMFLLLITGLETDLALIRRQARTAIGASLGGIVVPFASGFALGQFLPDDLLIHPDGRLVFSLFIATAMSISAIPVIAKVLIDLNLIRRDIGQTIIAAAMVDDTVGWILLSIVVGLASGEAVTVGSVVQSVGSVLAFMILSFTAGRWLVQQLLTFVQDELKGRYMILSLVLVMVFIWAAIAQALRLEAVLGAFVMGIIFSQMRNFPQEVLHTLESVALGIFAPIFFAVAGLKVNVNSLLEPRLIGLTLIVIAVATFGKVVGAYVGATTIGRTDRWTALSFGVGMNARGALEIIVASIGLAAGILTQDMFSIIVVMAMATSLMAPPALRWTLSKITPNPEELQRLRQEELNRDSLIPNIRRVLLPVRPRTVQGVSQVIEGAVLEKLGQALALDVTLITVTEPAARNEAQSFLDQLAGSFGLRGVITRRIATREGLNSSRINRMILDEAQKGYDLMILGTAEGPATADVLFNPLLDALIRFSPCPVLLVHGQKFETDWQPRRILVPTNGSLVGRRAAELAFALAANTAHEVILLWVIEESESDHLDTSGASVIRQQTVANRSLVQLSDLAAMQGVVVQTDVRLDPAPERVILEVTAERNIDLVILGTTIGVNAEQLYLGRKVERILAESPCPVIVLNP